LIDGRTHRGFDLVLSRDVARREARGELLGAELEHFAPARILVDIRQEHFRPFAGERVRAREADTLRGPGDEGDFSGEPHGVTSSWAREWERESPESAPSAPGPAAWPLPSRPRSACKARPGPSGSSAWRASGSRRRRPWRRGCAGGPR